MIPGLFGIMPGTSTTAAFSSVMTVGTASYEYAYDPKTSMWLESEANGFADADVNYGSFGSMTVDEWQGFPIVALYQDELQPGVTQFVVTGDATAFTPTLRVDGVDQNLGAGSYVGGKTGFSGTATDPFVGKVTVPVTID